MRLIFPDPARMIDLPGVGPCPRPVDIDQRLTGFQRLKSLRIYRFEPGPAIHGESEVDEVFITALEGRFAMAIDGPHALEAELGPGGALYMTPDHAYRLTPLTPCVVAYARAEAEGRIPSAVIEGREAEGEDLRWQLIDLAPGAGMELGGAGVEALVHVARGAITCGGVAVAAGQTLVLAEAAQLSTTTGAGLLILSA